MWFWASVVMNAGLGAMVWTHINKIPGYARDLMINLIFQMYHLSNQSSLHSSHHYRHARFLRLSVATRAISLRQARQLGYEYSSRSQTWHPARVILLRSLPRPIEHCILYIDLGEILIHCSVAPVQHATYRPLYTTQQLAYKLSPPPPPLLSLIHIWRCRRSTLCRSRWSPYH